MNGLTNKELIEMVEKTRPKEAEFYKALDLYSQTFNNRFPTVPLMETNTKDEAVEMIKKCVAENKDVYEMGYLTLDDEIQY